MKKRDKKDNIVEIQYNDVFETYFPNDSSVEELVFLFANMGYRVSEADAVKALVAYQYFNGEEWYFDEKEWKKLDGHKLVLNKLCKYFKDKQGNTLEKW